jgi:dTDP-4-amino-4,6-dideoxygalactose transaminase
MTDIQAALGLSQLARLDRFLARRNLLARRYDQILQGLPLRLPEVLPENLSSFHLYVVRLQRHSLRKSHRQVFEELRQHDIGVNLHYLPVHLQPYYRDLGFRPGQYPEAEAHAQEALTLALYPALEEHVQDAVAHALARVTASA